MTRDDKIIRSGRFLGGLSRIVSGGKRSIGHKCSVCGRVVPENPNAIFFDVDSEERGWVCDRCKGGFR